LDIDGGLGIFRRYRRNGQEMEMLQVWLTLDWLLKLGQTGRGKKDSVSGVKLQGLANNERTVLFSIWQD